MRLVVLISKPYSIVNEIATLISSIKLGHIRLEKALYGRRHKNIAQSVPFCLTDITKQTGVGGVHSNLEKG